MINRQSYNQFWLSKTYNIEIGKDYLLDEHGNITAWNSSKGTQPTISELDFAILNVYKNNVSQEIDTIAGEIRQSYLAEGRHIAEEYRLAEDDAKKYIDSNYTITVPKTLADYASIVNVPANILANIIIQKSNEFKIAFGEIRKIRLIFKAKVSIATSIEQISQLLDNAKIELNKLMKK